MRSLTTLLLLGVVLSGCAHPAAHVSQQADHAAPKTTVTHGATKPLVLDPHAPHAATFASAEKLPVPFVGEGGSLEVAKGFMHALFSDNEAFVSANPAAHFAPFQTGQKPRATVLTCSDSRVQANAFDKAAENDLFTVRNIGNQFKTAEGSVLYGVEHLATSVLLVLGHSGCGAVKAAMSPHADLEAPIRAEVDGIVIPPRDLGANDADALSKAIVSNVHDQVRAAIGVFGERVREGRLVIVGAVYDFRNDLKQGYGKLIIVDVNGTSDPASIAAFSKGVEKPAL